MAPALVLASAIGLVVWLTAFAIRRRRIGWVVASGCLSAVIGVFAIGLAFVGYALGCGTGMAGCPSDFSVVEETFSNVWGLSSAGFVLFGIGLWVYAIYLDLEYLRNLGELHQQGVLTDEQYEEQRRRRAGD